MSGQRPSVSGAPELPEAAEQAGPPAALSAASQRVRVLGIGNDYRRDDGVGLWIARQIATGGWPDTAALALPAADAPTLLLAWQGADRVYVVDALRSSARPGSVVALDVQRAPRLHGLSALSSHGLGLAAAIDLGRAIGLLPPRLVVYGIVGADFGHGHGLSPPVRKAARQVLRQLRDEVAKQGGRRA